MQQIFCMFWMLEQRRTAAATAAEKRSVPCEINHISKTTQHTDAVDVVYKALRFGYRTQRAPQGKSLKLNLLD